MTLSRPSRPVPAFSFTFYFLLAYGPDAPDLLDHPKPWVKTMRADKIVLEKVGPANLAECGIGCLVNRKNQGFQRKVEWLHRRFTDGLRFFLFRDGEGRPLGFLEYVPGEHAWRPVDARGWLFVHCLWVYPRGQRI